MVRSRVGQRRSPERPALGRAALWFVLLSSLLTNTTVWAKPGKTSTCVSASYSTIAATTYSPTAGSAVTLTVSVKRSDNSLATTAQRVTLSVTGSAALSPSGAQTTSTGTLTYTLTDSTVQSVTVSGSVAATGVGPAA